MEHLGQIPSAEIIAACTDIQACKLLHNCCDNIVYQPHITAVQVCTCKVVNVADSQRMVTLTVYSKDVINQHCA